VKLGEYKGDKTPEMNLDLDETERMEDEDEDDRGIWSGQCIVQTRLRIRVVDVKMPPPGLLERMYKYQGYQKQRK
jgi:hypothetical protein